MEKNLSLETNAWWFSLDLAKKNINKRYDSEYM